MKLIGDIDSGYTMVSDEEYARIIMEKETTKNQQNIKIGDRVTILSTTKYGHRCDGKLGVVKSFYKDNIAVRIDDEWNSSARDGVFYFDRKYLKKDTDATDKINVHFDIESFLKYVSFRGDQELRESFKKRENVNYHEMRNDPMNKYTRQSMLDMIENVIFSDPATIVFWRDGTKTVVKCSKNDIYDPEKGLAMAIVKRYFGNDTTFHKVFKKWMPGEENV